MWFMNKKTELKWDVSDKPTIARLKKDADFKEIEAKPKETKTKKVSK